mmetsp:Transcript_22545/g.58318  ORF Transcript_22545/g.58318 Transcript_22545/m.58318 type:complete len:205 (-) Transcript_22545:1896-2510(-)
MSVIILSDRLMPVALFRSSNASSSSPVTPLPANHSIAVLSSAWCGQPCSTPAASHTHGAHVPPRVPSGYRSPHRRKSTAANTPIESSANRTPWSTEIGAVRPVCAIVVVALPARPVASSLSCGRCSRSSTAATSIARHTKMMWAEGVKSERYWGGDIGRLAEKNPLRSIIHQNTKPYSRLNAASKNDTPRRLHFQLLCERSTAG